MKDKAIEDPFYSQIQREIDKFENKADLYTRMFYFIRLLQIAIAAAITVLSGLEINPALFLILGVVMTVVTAIDTLFQIDAKKNTYKLVLFELRTIRAEFVYGNIQSTINPKLKSELFEKYKKAISYARDLIGTDPEKEAAHTEKAVASNGQKDASISDPVN